MFRLQVHKKPFGEQPSVIKGVCTMKRFEYFKLNFNMAKNETMIAAILAFIAPIIASLGEKESIRSFLMGTDGPSMVQIIAGGALLAVAVFLLIKGVIKIGYDNLYGETGQMYSSLPIPASTVVLTKISVLTINSLISLLGLSIGMAMAYAFGNNEKIDSLFETLESLATAKTLEHNLVIPLSIILFIAIVVMINSDMFLAFANSSMKPKGLLGKLALIAFQIMPACLVIYSLGILDPIHVMLLNLDEAWIYLLISIAVVTVLNVLSIGVAIYRIKKTYYI